jgi:hypothetical protein
VGYIAPEIHIKNEQGERNYLGDKVDLFAAGVALFLMVVRIVPFSDTVQTNS